MSNANLFTAVADDPILGLTAAELAAKIHARELTSVEVTQAFLDRIAAVDGGIHAFLHIGAEEALAAAKAVDESLDAGEAPASALAGVPLALKDVFVTTDAPTTCASKMLEGYMSPYDATVTEKLRAAGIPILGKTNMDEFAMGSSTENSAYGPTHNPWDVERTAGGSGGGSSAALAAAMAPLAIGTDTGGSIRQPAALTATVGVKPTYGTVSRHGLVACASSLDQGGPTARTVLDTALLHEVIAGHDERDSTSTDQPIADVVADQVMAKTRAEGFGAEVKRRIIIGTYALSVGYYDAYYIQAQRVRTLIQQDFERAFEQVDVLVSPTTPTTAFKLGEKVDDPLSMYMFDLCTLPLNLAGMCGMSVPSGLAPDTGLPVGLQIMAPRHGDDRLYKVGAAYEKVRGPVA